MLISVPISRPILGVVLCVVIWAITYLLPDQFLNPIRNPDINVDATATARLLSCLLPNMALAMHMQLLQQKDIYGFHAGFKDLFEPVGVFGGFTIGCILVTQAISSLLMCIFIWYLDAVWPWQDGVAKSYYFPFTKSYWFGNGSAMQDGIEYSPKRDKKYFERQLSQAETSVAIRNLRKVFGNKVAVDGISLDINHGQITCLLGQNGAGKTTTMNMITGIFSATSGSVTVNGYDVATQTNDARRSMSLCPQHNVLYNELNVIEHLQMYAAIKGIIWSQIGNEADIAADKAQLSAVVSNGPPSCRAA